MSASIEVAQQPLTMHSLRDVTTMLLKHHGIHEGLYELAIEMQFAMGPVGPSPDGVMPGVAIGFSRIGLRPAPATGPLIVDAAVVNPAPRKRGAPAKRLGNV